MYTVSPSSTMYFASPRRNFYSGNVATNNNGSSSPSTTFSLKPRPWGNASPSSSSSSPYQQKREGSENKSKLLVKRVSLTASAPSLANVMGRQVVPSVNWSSEEELPPRESTISPTKHEGSTGKARSTDVKLQLRRHHSSNNSSSAGMGRRSATTTPSPAATLLVPTAYVAEVDDDHPQPQSQQQQKRQLSPFSQYQARAQEETEQRIRRDRQLAEEARHELLSRRIPQAKSTTVIRGGGSHVVDSTTLPVASSSSIPSLITSPSRTSNDNESPVSPPSSSTSSSSDSRSARSSTSPSQQQQPLLSPSPPAVLKISTTPTVITPQPSSQQPIRKQSPLVVRVSNLLKEDKLNQALSECQTAVQGHSDESLEAWLLGGRLHLYRGDTLNANRWFKQALVICTTNMPVVSYETRSKVQEATRKEMVRLAGSVEAKKKCVELLSCGKHNQMSEAPTPSGGGEGKKIPLALQLVESAVEVSPGCASYRVLLAAVHLACGGGGLSNPLVLKEIKQAFALAPSDMISPSVLRPAIQYARSMHHAGLADIAMLFLTCVRDVGNSMGGAGGGGTTDERANSQSSLIAKEIARYQEMENAKSLANQAYTNGRYEDAVELFSKALMLDPSHHGFNAVLLANRAAAWMALGNFAHAVDDCDAALSKLPTFFKARLRRGRALMKLSRWKDAVIDFEAAYRLNPTSFEVSCELEAAKRALDEATARRKDFETHGYHRSTSSSSTPQQKPAAGSHNSGNAAPFSYGNGRGGSSNSGYQRGYRSSSTNNGAGPEKRQQQSPLPPPVPPTRTSPPRAPQQTFYELLGVTPTASNAEIKKAYHKLALKHHPDKNVGDVEAVARFKVILDAFNTLRDPTLRRRYDDSFRLAAKVI